jgi:CRISPR-associated protein Cas5d
MGRGFCLEVWGDFACFTRPEMKAERVSYDIITPSAAIGIFEAIFWKPEIIWQINKIEVLNPIKWTTIRRNEVDCKMGSNPFYITDNEGTNHRQQRASLLLKDVRYRIHACFEFVPGYDHKHYDKAQNTERILSKSECEAKYAAMFERRASKGQYFHQPYLGCREFPAYFRLIRDIGGEPQPIQETRDLGYMLYGMDFTEKNDNPAPMFFRAEMKNGIIEIPAADSQEVLK